VRADGHPFIRCEFVASPRPKIETEHRRVDAHQQDVAQRPQSIEGFAVALAAVLFAKK
jgi:hypothetical protein